jgi:hypothetical protein
MQINIKCPKKGKMIAFNLDKWTKYVISALFGKKNYEPQR